MPAEEEPLSRAGEKEMENSFLRLFTFNNSVPHSCEAAEWVSFCSTLTSAGRTNWTSSISTQHALSCSTSDRADGKA